jgi:hypothetical protein
MWFTETPWPPMVLFVVAAIGCAWMWGERRRSWWLVGMTGCVALAIGVLVFERSITTPAEQIQQHLMELASAFQDQDEAAMLSFVSPRAEKLRNQIRLGLATVSRVGHLRITDTNVTLLAEGSRAKLHFRANGTFELAGGFGDVGHRPTRWVMTWQQEGGIWKAIDVQRLNTITGEPIGMLSAED